ncbi:MAG: hypothetical protein JXE06_03585 [Coriobacteriia bacterium]|nr:hypothetical protein [Coriobacteriia bacterium]MBN2821666.1 hypothetical protein [Coriobacteriia bacterium]
MKRVLMVALAFTLALTAAGCGGGGASTQESSDSTGASSGGDSISSTAIASPADLRAAIDRDHADAEWYSDVTDISLETYLGAPVAVVHVTWPSTGTDYVVSNRKQTAISEAMSAYEIAFAPNRALVTADGAVSRLGSSSGSSYMPMNDVYTLPAAPTTAAEFKTWLDSVYGPGGLVTLGADETWYAAIDSVEMEDGTLKVKTSLAREDLTQRDLLGLAMQTTGSPLLSKYGISGADGSYVGGSVGGMGEPGMNGLYYKGE